MFYSCIKICVFLSFFVISLCGTNVQWEYDDSTEYVSKTFKLSFNTNNKAWRVDESYLRDRSCRISQDQSEGLKSDPAGGPFICFNEGPWESTKDISNLWILIM